MMENILRRVLRAVFGGGADISAANPLEVHDPKVGSLISYEGITTANGGPGGVDLFCADLAAPAHPEYDGNEVIITSGDYAGQARDINGTTLLGTVTPASPFGGQILSGTHFVIAAIRTTPAEGAALEAEVAALEAKIEDLKAKQMMIDTSQVFYVSPTGSDLNDGLTWATAFVSIDHAVSQCVDDRGDVVFVAKHTYNENAHGTLGVRCNKRGVRIIGVGEGVFVSNSDVSGPGSAFTITASGVVLENMEVDKTDGAFAHHVIDINGDGIVGVRLVDIRIEVPNAASTGLRMTGGPGLGPIRAIFCNGYRKRASISCTTGLLGTGIDFDVCRECKVGGSIYSLDVGCNFGAGGDSNLLTRDTEISNCNTGIQLAAGATGNVLDASITNCPTEYSDASGNYSNNRHSSLTFIRNDVAHVPKYTGKILYVDGATGIDTNSGQSPEEARATITGALAAAVAGDRIKVRAGTYDEALVMNLAGLELICEQGTILVNTAGGGGTPLVVGPANYQRVVGAILNQAGQTGLQITGDFCSIEDCLAYACATGFDDDGLETHFKNCRSIEHTATGFDISNGFGQYERCIAATSQAGTTGIDLSAGTADHNHFLNCHTLGNATAGWNVVGGADNNLFSGCSTGAGDGAKSDLGTNNTWDDFSEGSQILAGQTRDQDLKDIYDRIGALTTFTQETHVAVGCDAINGTTWVDLLDKSPGGASPLTKPTKICGFLVTVSAGWTGKARLRIVDGADTKIFPFQAYYEQDAEGGFVSGTQVVFNFEVVVPVADGYKLQFCSSNGADGAGNTVTLDNLDVIEVG